MAVWIEWTEAQKKIYAAWLAERPQIIREMVEKYNLSPDKLYLRKSTGKRVTLHSLEDNGTVTVKVLPEFNVDNFVWVPSRVFGVPPDDLEECDCPIEVVNGEDIREEDEE